MSQTVSMIINIHLAINYPFYRRNYIHLYECFAVVNTTAIYSVDMIQFNFLHFEIIM